MHKVEQDQKNPFILFRMCRYSEVLTEMQNALRSPRFNGQTPTLSSNIQFDPDEVELHF